MRTFSTLLFSAMFLLTSSVTAGEPRTSIYIVRNGDSLSQIADQIKGGHTYGKGENLEQILQLNPHVDFHRKLVVGERITIPVHDLRNVASETVANDTAEKSVTPPVAPIATPSPSALPVAPSVQAPVVEEEDVEHRFDLKAGYQVTTINADDKVTLSKAELNSDHDFFASLSWSQKWSEKFKSFFSFTGRQIDFQPSTNVAKKISDSSKTLLGMEAGSLIALKTDLALQLSAAYGSELFLHGISTTNVAIDTMNISKISLGLNYQFYKKGSTALGLAISGSYLSGASTDTYTIDAGSSYKGALFIRREKNGRYLSLEVGASQRVQNTSVSDLTEANIFGQVTYGFDLFSREKP